MSAAAIDLVQREISNPDTQWSLGTFGTIAEFSRDQNEPVRLSVRIALRQMKSQGHASAALSAWLASFDQAALTKPTTKRPFIMRADLTRKCAFFDRK